MFDCSRRVCPLRAIEGQPNSSVQSCQMGLFGGDATSVRWLPVGPVTSMASDGTRVCARLSRGNSPSYLQLRQFVLYVVGMIADALSSDSSSADEVAKKGSFSRYAALLALLFVIRLGELAFSGRFSGTTWWWSFGVLSIVASGLTVFYARRSFPPVMVVLLAALAGGTAMMVVNSIPGMLIGLFIGLATAFDWSRRWSWAACRLAAVTVIPGVLVGLAIGFAGSWSTLIRVAAPRRIVVSLFVVALSIVLTVLLSSVLSRWRRPGLGRAALFAATIWLSLLATVPVGIEFDTWRRVRVARTSGLHVWSHSIFYDSNFNFRFPWPHELLTKGLSNAANIHTEFGLTSSQAAELTVFHDLESVYGGRWRNEDPATRAQLSWDGLSDLDLESLSYATIVNSNLDDQGLRAFADCKNLLHFNLQGNPKITDQSLEILSNMPFLSYLDLSRSSVNGSGLRHLHPKTKLSHLLLAETAVVDASIEQLSSIRSLVLLDLSDTRITGSNLWRLQIDDPVASGINTLRLSNSDFREENLDAIPCGTMLYLDGVSLTKSGVEDLVCLCSESAGIGVLSIRQTGLDDDAAVLLEHLDIHDLRIDATHLTDGSSPAFVYVQQLTLEYEIAEWLASGRTLEDLFHTYKSIRIEVDRLRRGRSIADPRLPLGAEVSLELSNIHVTRDMAKLLMSEPCKLINATIEGHDVQQTEFDGYEMPRFFPEEFAEPDSEE